MIACLGETTGLQTLSHILEVMKSTTEGTEILLNKPRINSKTVDLDALGRLPDDTFGFHYKKFLDDNVILKLNLHVFKKKNWSHFFVFFVESNSRFKNGSKVFRRPGNCVYYDTVS